MAKSQAVERTTRGYLERLWAVEAGDLPPATVDMTKRLIADLVGVAVAGQRSPELDAVVDLARTHYAEGRASIYGDPDRLSPIGAAMANGTTGHGWDFDDTYDASPLHASSPVLPAALALAQHADASGAAAVRAAALGIETHMRLALACEQTIMDTGWHRTALHGTFGAVVAGSAILDLTPEEAEHAVSIAYSQTAGHLQVTEGGTTKRFQPGHAAAAGVKSALLARNGLTGPADPWFGRFGFFETYEDDVYSPETVFDDLGESFLVPDLSLKPYPCCRYVHTTIDAGLALREADGVTLDDVESATVFVNADGHTACAEPQAVRYAPETCIQLQFNLPYALAISLADGRPGLEHFTTDAVDRANALPLERIETAVTDEFDEGYADKISPARVRVTTTEGRTHEVTRIDPKGHPNNRMTDDEFRTKFTECVAFSELGFERSAIDDVLALFDRLETLDSVDPVFRTLDGTA